MPFYDLYCPNTSQPEKKTNKKFVTLGRYVSLDTLVPSPASADGEVKSFGGQVDELLEAEETLDEQPRTATRAQLVEALVARRAGSLNISTSEKPTARSWSLISLRASCAIDASGTTAARAFAVNSSAGRSDAVPASSSTCS